MLSVESASAVADAGLYPVYGANGLRGYTNSSNFKGQCALIGRQGAYCSNVKYFSGEGYITEHAVVLQANGLADTQYLAYRLSILDLGRLSGQSAQPGLSVKDLANQIVDLPSLDVQRSVANLLSALDRKIALNRKKIATLEKMAKEIYDYWFVQYDFPDANGRPYKSSGGEMVYSPELKREIPKGWRVTKIADVLAKIPSTERVQTVNYADSGTIPIIDQSEKFIAGYTENNATALALKSCVVFGDHSCTVKYVNFRFARGADGTQILHSNTPLVDDTQLYFNLLEMDFDEGYKRHFSALKDKLIVISPNASLTATYTSVVDGLFAQIRVLRQKTNTISALRDFLLPLLMNGQVKLR